MTTVTTGNEALRRRFFLLPLSVGREDGQDLNCLFTQNQVVEALGRTTRIYPAPFTPPYLLGSVLRHDALIPVIDLDALCGGAERGKRGRVEAHQMLVIRTGRQDANGEFLRLAVACSGTVITFKLTDRELARPVEPLAAPAGFAGQGLAGGFFRLRDHRVVVMDFDALVQGSFRPPANGGQNGVS